jgi:transcriptional regulator with GAF, ATPase, and Fis domain
MQENKLVKEVALRLYQSLKIEESLYHALCYLHEVIPMDNLHAGVYDREKGDIRYLASATLEGGSLIDETIQLSQGAIEEVEANFSPGRAIIINNPFQSVVIRNLIEFQVTIPESRQVYDPGNQFSAMSLILDFGYPLYGLCTMVTAEVKRYDQSHKKLFELLARPLTGAILNLFHHRQILSRNEQLEQNNQELRHRLGFSDTTQMIGAEGGLKSEIVRASQVAIKDTPVLITGETGTGKEVMAHAIHRLSKRRNGPMLCINCGAIPETLVDSELFGHEKGAFTGADKKKRGYFEQANGGTIFLDEVGELTAAVQVKLLRVLQDKTLHRLGGTRAIAVDIRIIAATHRDLPALIADRRFREDLWFRLNVFPIEMPPLRKRLQDIPGLVDYLMLRKAREMHLSFIPRLGNGAIDSLMKHSWPGNIRELDNIIERNLIICNGKPLTFPELEINYFSSRKQQEVNENPLTLDEIIIQTINNALNVCNGVVSGPDGAAQLLGLNPSTLRGKMRKYKIA